MSASTLDSGPASGPRHTRRGAGPRRRRRLWDAVAVTVVLAVALGTFVVRFGYRERHTSGDTYFYVLQAELFGGTPRAQAERHAREVLCSDVAGGLTLTGYAVRCSSYDVITRPRYVAIFTSRPLWPVVLALPVRILGPLAGLVLVTVTGAMLAALAVFLALRGLSLSTIGAAAAGVAFSLLPTGYWSDKLLPEGIVLAVLAAALYGAGRVVRGHVQGLAVLLPAMAALYAFKPANGAALAGGLLVAGLLVLALSLLPGAARGRRAALVLAGAGAVGVVGWFAVSAALHLPSFNDTVQDLATFHFSRPDRPHPLEVLKSVNLLMWREQIGRFLGLPWPLAVVLPAAVVTVLGLRRAGVVWVVVSLAGFSIAVLHPLVSQYDRLAVSVWLCVVAAVAVLVDAALRLAGRTGRHALPPPLPSRPDPVHTA